MNVIKCNWIPFIDKSSNRASFRVCLIARIAVRIQTICKCTCIGNISVRIFCEIKEEDEFLEKVFNGEGYDFLCSICLSRFKADLVLGCERVEQAGNNINSRLLISMCVVDEDRKFVV